MGWVLWGSEFVGADLADERGSGKAHQVGTRARQGSFECA
jgi:hypothetical protein